MRNLVALRRASWRLADKSGAREEDTSSVQFTINLGEQLVYFLHPQSGRIDTLAIDDVDAELELLVELSDAILTADGAQWKWIEYVAELDAIVCGSTGGALAVVDLQSREPEEIGALDGGIVGMAWSSNQETLVIATGVGSLLIMNTQWEVLHETYLQAHLPQELSLPEVESPVATTTMAWRDDAQYLVVNVAAIDNKSARSVRKVLVFTQQLEFHATGRLEDGRDIPHVGDSVDWCPNHSLIVSHETRKDQLFVVFFERNGLRHGEFSLPSELSASSTKVKQIQWNTHSDVLAVHVEAADKSCLLLWVRSNYHWYLKQEIAFDRVDGSRLSSFEWDDERATLVHLLMATSSGQSRYEQLEFAWDVSCGERRLSNGQSSVVTAVVDGHKLLLTPVHQALMPPPMALHTLSFAAPVNSIVFDKLHETLAVALSTGDVVLVDKYLADASASAKASQRVIHSDTSISSLLFLHTDPSINGDVVVAAKTGADDALVVWAVTSEDDARLLIPTQDVAGVARASYIVSADAGVPLAPQFALQTRDGRALHIAIDDEEVRVAQLPLSVAATVLPLLTRFQVVQLTDNRFLTIGVSAATAKLVVNGVAVAVAACSSFHFCAFSSVLLYTTLGSAAELRLVPLAALVSNTFAHSADQATSNSNGSSRVIERGARIVAVVGDRASVILQMPRGNLEGTSPRLLVLALVVKQIQRLEYARALEMSRRHRLDLNLLVDFDPDQFLSHFAEHLIRELLVTRSASVVSDRLCLFITNLHVVDVWTTKYGLQLRPFLTDSTPQLSENNVVAATVATGQDKLNRTCQAMMQVIYGRQQNDSDADKDALLLPLLTAAVKQSPPDFHAALAQVQLLLQEATSTRAKRAVKHLIFLTQVDLLFEEALGLYDLPLVRFIATYSQRDPKDYMPFLHACEATEDSLVRQYKIDSFLKRHVKALGHLSQLLVRGDASDATITQYEQEAGEIIVKGKLYDQALTLFPSTPSSGVTQRLHRRVLQLKADYLVSQSEFEAAGFVYLSISAYTEAMQAFKSARAWQMALAAAAKAKLAPKTELRAFAYELTQALLSKNEIEQQDVLAAARIYVEYCDDVDEAVALLVLHKHWDESVRVAHLHQRADLIETDIETGVTAAYDMLCDDIAQRQAEYVKQWKRLTTIREQKRLFKLHGIDGSRWEQHGDADTKSMASGVSSVADSALSAASGRSVGSHNSAVRNGNFALQSLTAATSSHFYSTQSQSQSQFGAASAAAYKAKRYGGLPSRTERRRRIKEGSVEEEVHVAKQLTANAPSASLLRETRDVLRALVFFGQTTKAEQLQSVLSSFEKLIRDEYPMLEAPSLVATDGVSTRAQSTDAESKRSVQEDAALVWRFPAFSSN